MTQQTVKTWDDVAKDIAPEPAFPNAEFVEDKQSLLGVKLIWKDFEEREGAQGMYLVVLAERDGKEITFSIGGVVRDQLVRAKGVDGLPLEAVMREKKSQSSGRSYWTLSGSEQ